MKSAGCVIAAQALGGRSNAYNDEGFAQASTAQTND